VGRRRAALRYLSPGAPLPGDMAADADLSFEVRLDVRLIADYALIHMRTSASDIALTACGLVQWAVGAGAGERGLR